MRWDISDLSKREAKVLLFIDNDFKYDDVKKAKKLLLYFENKKIFRSNSAKRFERKFEQYIETGHTSSSCPLCNSFAEGKQRLLCAKCVERLEAYSEGANIIQNKKYNSQQNRVENSPILNSSQNIIKQVNNLKEIPNSYNGINNKDTSRNRFVQENNVDYYNLSEKKVDIDEIEQSEDDTIIFTKDKYVIIPKRKFYVGMVGAIALALIINFLIALPYFFSTDSIKGENYSEITSEEVPTSGR